MQRNGSSSVWETWSSASLRRGLRLLRLGEIVDFSMPVTLVALVSVFTAMPVFAYFGLYRAIFRHVGSLALLTVAKAILVYAALFGFVVIQIGMEGVPRTVGVLHNSSIASCRRLQALRKAIFRFASWWL